MRRCCRDGRVSNDTTQPNLLNCELDDPMQVKEKEKELRILILGLDNAGKTTILKYVQRWPCHTPDSSSFDSDRFNLAHDIIISKGSFAASASTALNQLLASTSKRWSTRAT